MTGTIVDAIVNAAKNSNANNSAANVSQDYSGQGGGDYGSGWGATRDTSSDTVNRMPENQPGVNLPAGGGGTYRDASGNLITKEQAQAIGRIDTPRSAQQKFNQIGGSAPTSFIEQRFAREDYNKYNPQPNKPLNNQPQSQPQYNPPTPQMTSNLGSSYNAFHPVARQTPQSNSIVLSQQQYDRYRGAMNNQVGRGVMTESEASGRALDKSGYTEPPHTRAVRMQTEAVQRAIQERNDAQTVRQAGGVRATGAILSSTSLFAKAAETEARGLAGLAGLNSGYSQSTKELMSMTADRLRNKPSLTGLVIESPITAAIPIGAGFKVGGYAARAGLMKAGSLASKGSPFIGSAITKSNLLIEPALIVGGIAYVGSDVVKSKDAYQAVGKIASYGAMTPGAVFGYGATSKAISGIKYIGVKSEFAPVKMEVLSGKETFPTTRAGNFNTFKKEFGTKTIDAYHATSEGYKAVDKITVRNVVPERPSDIQGLYVSPINQGASAAFLRIQGASMKSTTSYKNFFSSSPMNPAIYRLKGFEGIARIKGGKNVGISRQFITTKAKQGMVYIEPKMEMGGFKGEAQGVVAPGTVFGASIKTTKTKIWGETIPIQERNVELGSVMKPQGALKQTAFDKMFKERNVYTKPSPSLPFSSIGAYVGILPSSKHTSSKSKISSFIGVSSYKAISSRLAASSRVMTSSRVVPSSIMSISSRITPSSRVMPSSMVSLSSYVAPSSRVTPSSRITPSSMVTPSSRVTPSGRYTPSRIKIPITNTRLSSALPTSRPSKSIMKMTSRLYTTSLGGKLISDMLHGKTKATKKRGKK